MKKLLKTILALVFAACCFMFASKCLNTGGMAGAIADLPTAIHRAVKGQMQTTTDYLNGEQAESLEQIGQGIEQLSGVVQGTAASSEENTAISINLAEGADKMNERVNRFKLF